MNYYEEYIDMYEKYEKKAKENKRMKDYYRIILGLSVYETEEEIKEGKERKASEYEIRMGKLKESERKRYRRLNEVLFERYTRARVDSVNEDIRRREKEEEEERKIKKKILTIVYENGKWSEEWRD